MRPALNQVSGFIKLHFATEERPMRTYEYPGFERHIGEHLEILSHLTDLLEGNPALRTFLDAFILLENRVLEHMVCSDTSFETWLAAED